MSNDNTTPPENTATFGDIGKKVPPHVTNPGALYHHINWTCKLLGQDLDELKDGDYILALSIRRRGGNTYVDRWSLAEGEEA